VQYVINNTYHKSVKSSPSKLLLGYGLRNQPDFNLISFLNNLAGVEIDLSNERVMSRVIATEATNKIKQYNKQYYDQRHKAPSVFKSGDYVMIRNTTLKPGEDKKLKHTYKGPYLVSKILNKNRYVIQDIPGFQLTQKPYNTILSPDRLKL